MESDDDFDLFSPTEEPSSPAPERKLKRLKKSKTIEENSPKFDTLDTEKSNSQDFEEPNLGSRSQLEGFEEEKNELDSGFDNLGAKRVLEFDSVAEEFDRKGEDRTEDVEMEEEIRDLRIEEPEKKRPSLDQDEEKKEKKKNKKKKRDKDNSAGGDDEKQNKSVASNKRREAKERRDNLIRLHAESQRLLRESRDATFKPVPLVQKPISSVLEKIRRRKQAVFKKSVILNKPSFVNDNDEFFMDLEPENSPIEEMEDYKAEKAASDETFARSTDVENGLDGTTEPGNQSGHESIPSPMDVIENSKQAFRAPIDDAQDLLSDSQTSDSKDELPDEAPSSPLEEVLAPSLLAMNLKLDSAPPKDISSDEEDNDKENIDPHLHRSVDLSTSSSGDPVKAFVDDEAAEEDDSDNDLFRFQDNDEDEDNEDIEELKDMIATGYEEKPTDTEKRNELHQKWLEQQDAAGTENFLQRLKCGSKQVETTLIEEEEDGEGEEDNEESGDEAAEDLVTTSVVRTNLRKAKQMISQMFTDLNDAYMSSDDEETDTRQVKQCLSEKANQQTKHLSPAKGEISGKVVIKKMNVAPDTKKKAKTSSFFNMTLTGGNMNVSSKSSFLGRGLQHSLPSSHKHGSSKGRSFIFERDDSNRRSAIAQPEDSLDMMQRENRPTKTASAKFSNSQTKSSTQITKSAAEMNPGTSLHEILRCSSRQSSHCTQDSMVCHTESVFAAFKLEKKTIKKEPGVSIRTG